MLWLCAGQLAIPFVRMPFVHKFKSEAFVANKKIISLYITFATLEILFSFMFLWGPFRQTYADADVGALLGFRLNASAPAYYYDWLPFITLVLSNALVALLFSFYGLDDLSFWRNFAVARHTKLVNKQFRGVFHSFKNVMVATQMLARQILEADSPEEKDVYAKRLQALSASNIERLDKVLEVFKSLKIYMRNDDVSNILDRALTQTRGVEGIKVVRNYTPGILVYCDPARLEESVANILANAVDAIRFSEKADGFIQIDVSADVEWVTVKITDNGNGIPKKEISRAFKAFYTTKASKENWGVGLNHALRSVKEMKGYLFIKSNGKSYASVYIILHRGERDGKKSDTNRHC
jgi:signal transduction histidine kinase